MFIFIDTGAGGTLEAMPAVNCVQMELKLTLVFEHLCANLTLYRLVTNTVHNHHVPPQAAGPTECLAALYTHVRPGVTDSMNSVLMKLKLSFITKRFAANLACEPWLLGARVRAYQI